jgi:excisionase family DNA binding protein
MDGYMGTQAEPLFDEIVYTQEELAELLQVSVKTLLRWHHERKGPARCQIGRFIRYRREAVNQWLIANENSPVKRPSRR